MNTNEKFKKVGELSDFVEGIKHPHTQESDSTLTMFLSLSEQSNTMYRLYNEKPIITYSGRDNLSVSLKETQRFSLDKETKDVIVNALEQRIRQLKSEIRGDLDD